MFKVLTLKRSINKVENGSYVLTGWHKIIKAKTGDVITKTCFGPLRFKISNRNIAPVKEQRALKEAEEAAKKAIDPTYVPKERKKPDIPSDPRFPEFLHLTKDGRSYFYAYPTRSPKHRIAVSYTLNGKPIDKDELIDSGVVSQDEIESKGVTTCFVIHLDELDKLRLSKKGGK